MRRTSRLACLLLLSLAVVACGSEEVSTEAGRGRALEGIIERLQSPKRAVWQGAIDELSWWDAHRAAPLVPLLRHEHRGVREGVAHALGEIRADDAAIVQALIAAIEDDDDYVRWKAVRALGRIGPASSEALETIRKIALSPHEVEVVQAAAKRAVKEIER